MDLMANCGSRCARHRWKRAPYTWDIAHRSPLTSRRTLTLPITLASTVLLIALLIVGTGSLASARNAATPSTAWTVYHGDLSGSGYTSVIKSVNTSQPEWTSPTLNGTIYGEPLVFAKNVYVATENDTVYALSAKTGRVVWERHLATPVPSMTLPCGNILPLEGITGTPVIDPARKEIYVVAFEMLNGHPAHVLVGLDAATGRLRMTHDVDPPGAAPLALLQRTGLTLDSGRVIFGMGGNYGDCAAYRGRVVSVSEKTGAVNFFTVDGASGNSQGAIWMGGGAPSVDSQGHVWVSTGNGSVSSPSDPYDDSDGVLELTSTMRLMQYFAPTTWASDNSQDLDMSMEPVLLKDGRVVIAGKSRIIFLLNGHHLGGISQGETNTTSNCSNDIDGGGAVLGRTVYLPCIAGTIAIRIGATKPSISILWHASTGGGPPIVAAGLVWSIGQNGVLYAYDPTTGAIRRQVSVGQAANHFPTPSVGDGLFLVPTATQVVAFRTTAS
jgi:outer membrane protein assembly factor BamB